MADKIANVLGLSLVVAGVVAVITNPQSAGVFTALANGWAGVVRSASGR